MISVFKKKQAYEIAIGKAPKPAESAYSTDFTKLQFCERLRAAVLSAAFFAASIMITS
jgi:hypothetical protein